MREEDLTPDQVAQLKCACAAMGQAMDATLRGISYAIISMKKPHIINTHAHFVYGLPNSFITPVIPGFTIKPDAAAWLTATDAVGHEFFCSTPNKRNIITLTPKEDRNGTKIARTDKTIHIPL